MDKYLIKRILLKNFKSVDEATIEFEGSNLNVLDGPNGFGKTTIYDAIQLVLTGKIRRIESNKIVTTNKGFSDYLLSKDQTQPTVVKIEFENIFQPNSEVILARKLIPNTLTNIQRRPGDFSHFQLYLLNNIEDENFENTFSEIQLNRLFNVENILDEYNLFHYIEQEENSFLFKQNEKDRMGAISKLFNIEREISEKQFLEKVKKKLVNARAKLEGDISKLENELSKDNITNTESSPYKPLIDSQNILDIPWDKDIVKPLDDKLKDNYFGELEEIGYLVSNFTDFKNQLKNEEIEKIIQNKNKLKSIVILGQFHNKYKDYENQYTEQLKLKEYKKLLSERNILKHVIDWGYLLNKLDLQEKKAAITQRIDLIKIHSQNSNEISILLNQMNQTRDKLLIDYKKLILLNFNDKSSCPFCGDTKDSVEELIKQINNRTQELKDNYDTSTQKINIELDNLFNEYLNEIINQIEQMLTVNSINEAFFEQLKSCYGYISDMDKALEWFQNIGINIELFCNNETTYVENLSEKIQILKLELEKKKLSVNDFCKEHIESFKVIYRNRFNRNDELILKITQESINEKKQYIENQYFLQSSILFQKVQQLKLQNSKLEEKFEALGRIIKVYNDNINRHRGKMISDIEIPFYIYSGKIIQNHQRGIGVFIKEDKVTNQEGETQLKSINFIPTQLTEHDIVHSFSSGQLSSTVIAFTLALNKVYGNKGLTSLLIDDPMQTMDEMNMSSFVELLRNEFTDRQIILSTHENNISLYLRYKFLKYSLSVAKINVKEELYVN